METNKEVKIRLRNQAVMQPFFLIIPHAVNSSVCFGNVYAYRVRASLSIYRAECNDEDE